MPTNKAINNRGTNTGKSTPTSATHNSNVDYSTGAVNDLVKLEDGGFNNHNDGLFEDTRK